MKRLNPVMALAVLLLLATPMMAGEHGEEIPVWPKRAPGVEANVELNNQYQENGHATNVVHPTLTVMRPPEGQGNGTGVVVCPGGGYHVLAIEHEGYAVGDWLNELGVTAFVLQYRVPRAKDQTHWIPPLQDAQRAVSYVRSHADTWQLAPDRIGILGFSAGGHLAATTSTRFDQRAYEPIDEVDQVSCRPNFTVLIYPAYITPAKAARKKSDEITVGPQTPPAFLAVTADDSHALSSLFYTMALREQDVPVELHVYPQGGHGYGLGNGEHAVGQWPKQCERWLRDRELLESRRGNP